ncbi:TIGR00266 family protein [Halobacteriaceae archaeon GCM10025711]
MEHDIESGPSYALLNVSLDQGEQVIAESSAMVSHDPGISIETNAAGGFLKSLSRSLLGGESFFQNTFTADDPGRVSFAPPLPGDITAHELEDETVYVQSGSFLASDPAIDLDTEFGGAKTFFGSEGLFLLRASGTGPLFMSSYGGITVVDLTPDDTYHVDTGHIVAFESTADFTVRRVGGLRSTVLSGEGLVAEFTGEGRIWIQTRSVDTFLSWLIPKLPSRPSNRPGRTYRRAIDVCFRQFHW